MSPAALWEPTGDWRAPRQEYLGPAPVGVGALEAHRLGFRGAGARLALVDLGWSEHRDLPSSPQRHNQRSAHGAMVLGCALGNSPGLGIRGVAPDATLVARSAPPPALPISEGVEEAIRWASSFDPHLLLIQVELQDGETQRPVEALPSVFQQLRELTERGVHVVMAAGNGRHDLSSLVDCNAQRIWRPGAPESGAILVAGGHPADWRPFSNTGDRIDAHAWGDRVVTSGGGALCAPDQSERRYARGFGGSSAAAAIIAGCVLLLDAATRSQGRPLSPAAMRALFRDPSLCTQRPKLGGMPDLVRILRHLELLEEGPG